MAWEGIEERLKKAFTVKVSFRAGAIGFPDTRLTIDDWLESIAESDEELLELEIPRIQFLENRWLIDELVQLEWDDDFSNRRAILAMYVGRRAYILFSDWTEYLVIAALGPKDKPALYRAVVGNILENRSFVPSLQEATSRAGSRISRTYRFWPIRVERISFGCAGGLDCHGYQRP
jgi:hypothetical protein